VPVFSIQGIEFCYEPTKELAVLEVSSALHNYQVDFSSHLSVEENIRELLFELPEPIILCDQSVFDSHLKALLESAQLPRLLVNASESFKSIDGATSVLNFMNEQRVGRTTTVVVFGGGIVQDVGAFACGVFKRGIPWVYVPTTLLAQTDSCIGSKSGLNFQGAKNQIGMFSAPRRVVINSNFLSTLPQSDIESGLGEAFRLSIIGGHDSFSQFEELLPLALSRDQKSLGRIVQLALSIKKSVIEVDEFDSDLRRSMNYGHSVGHAIEALTNYAIPHGIAVAIGLIIENEISVQAGLLSHIERDRILSVGSNLIGNSTLRILEDIDLTGIVDLLFQDKKTETGILKLVIPKSFGDIVFVDFPLTNEAMPRLEFALQKTLERLGQ
jgi:3-dehydroquinate synthase